MFYYGWVAFKPMESDPPDDAIHIETTARMWKWNFKYENGKRLDSLIVPVGKAVSLDVTAVDVIHSLYIPAFRIKKDIVPGSPRTLWFIANSPGKYDLFCTEYCGLEHSSMITTVTVVSQEEYEKFAAGSGTEEIAGETSAAEVTPAMPGRDIMLQIGCNACHTTDGTTRVGPSYLGLFGSETTVITNGKERKVMADEEYIRKSILDPNADVVQGFNKGLMLSYKDQLSDEEITQIIEYIKTIQ
jgi:cytochrome c oxidase subunit 2